MMNKHNTEQHREQVNSFRKNLLANFFKNVHLKKWQWQKWYLWNDADDLLENCVPDKEYAGYFKNGGTIPAVLSDNIEALLEPDANVLVLGSAGGDYPVQLAAKLKEKFPGGNPKIIGVDISYPLLEFSRKKLDLLAAPAPGHPNRFAVFSGQTNLSAVLAEKKPFRKGPLVYFSRPQLLEAGAGRVHLVNSELLTLPFKDRCMDIVFADNTLYWLSDLAGALREVNRVLIPGGRFIFHKEFTGMNDDYLVGTDDGFGKIPLGEILKRCGFSPTTVCDYESESGNKILIDHLKANNAVEENILLSKAQLNLCRRDLGDRDSCAGRQGVFSEGVFLIAQKTGPGIAPPGEFILQTVANPGYDEFLLGSMMATAGKYRIAFVDPDGTFYSPRPDNYKKIFKDGDLA
jgi:SAM-dependent methyltransferase